MPRFKLVLEYDGTPFVGWQRQNDGRSVQAALEAAIAKLSGETVTATAAGRTDSGVHALGQVAHVDLTKDWPPHTVRDALNFHLQPDPIAVIEATVVPDDFSARFSAVERRYLYRILNRRALPVLERHRVWHVPHPLDAAAMHDAARILVGHHDFSTFRAAMCQARSPEKTLDQLDVSRLGDDLDLVAEALAARDRARGGPTAPAEGLYLTGVRYG